MPTPPDGWELVDGAIRRELRFSDFNEAFAFMTRIALIAAQRDHHPDWYNSYNTVVISLRSHDVGEITDRDIRMANAIDSIYDPQQQT